MSGSPRGGKPSNKPASERASEPRERSAPVPFDFAQGVVSVVEPTQRRARERDGESEGRSPSVNYDTVGPNTTPSTSAIAIASTQPSAQTATAARVVW